jgi:hypothetical protein
MTTPLLLNNSHFQQYQINNISSIVFDTLSISQSDSKDVMLKKFQALQSFRDFLSQFVDFKKLSSKEAKLQYIDFMDNLNQQIEELEILSGQISQKELDTIAKNFSQKTQFPIGFTE